MDEKDHKILNELQENCRASLTELAKKIGLSIDATHARLKKLQKNGFFYPTVLVDPRKIGYPVAVDVKIKLKDIAQGRFDDFVAFMVEHPNITSLFAVAGDYDLTAPMIARTYDEYQEIAIDIRQKFKHLIADWRANVNLKVYKFEEYDVERLCSLNEAKK